MATWQNFLVYRFWQKWDRTSDNRFSRIGQKFFRQPVLAILGEKCCLETTCFTWPLGKNLVTFFGERKNLRQTTGFCVFLAKKWDRTSDNRFWRFWAKNVVWRQHLLHGHLVKFFEKSNTRQPVFEDGAKVVQTTGFGDFGRKMLSGDNMFYMATRQKVWCPC